MTTMVTPCLSLFFIITPFMVTVLGKPQNNEFRNLKFSIQRDINRIRLFYATLDIGNPPKPYNLYIDTGSSKTWVRCRDGPGTKLVKGPNPLYQPNNNVMLCKEPLCAFFEHPEDYPCKSPDEKCGYVVQYADGHSSSGVVVLDDFSLTFTDQTAYRPTLAFGCGYHTPFENGVLGLNTGGANIVSQLNNFGAIKNVIGHCLGRQGKGFLFLGDNILPLVPAWVPLKANAENKYLLGSVDLFFDGKVPIAKHIDVIVDSGCTYTHLSSKVYKATLSQIKLGLETKPLSLSTVSDGIFSVCWEGLEPFKSVDEVKGYFSPLVLRFTVANDVAFELRPEDYLVIRPGGNVCLGILNRSKLRNMNIIGVVSMLDKLVVYDNEMHMIGWTPRDCNSDQNELIIQNATQVVGQKQEQMDE